MSLLTAIINGELYCPEHRGTGAIVMAGGTIVHAGSWDPGPVRASGLTVDVLDASDCIVAPGIIDPHEHLSGGSGESGWASQTPPLTVTELAGGGLTTGVGR